MGKRAGGSMTVTGNKKVLIVEDDRDILHLVKMYLDKEGFRTLTAENGAEAIRQAKYEHPDLIILDLMLPEIDGLEVCKKLRLIPQTSMLPIVIMTAKSEEHDRVVGLELGADDYLTKPFSPRELVARVKALFRRLNWANNQEVSAYRYGSLNLDLSRHEVTVDGQEVTLTAKEFGLLKHLLQNQGRVLTRDVLLNNVWGYDYHGTTRTVDVHVRRIKQKLPILNEVILSIKSLGYKIKEDSVPA
jgi:two-component system, OmpR family, alkaline phosphatase synthesis response regulator PhoP